MHDMNSEIWLDARGDFGWMRARARDACRQPARLLISRALWLLGEEARSTAQPLCGGGHTYPGARFGSRGALLGGDAAGSLAAIWA